MKLDYAITDFLEKYNDVAMDYIDELSNNLGMNANGIEFKVFNINEGFDRFDEYLRGYGKYKIDNIGNDNATKQEDIRESVHNFITEHVFEEKGIQYKELPNFVRGYVNGVTKLLETVDNVKADMMDSGVELEAVGDVNNFVDEFMDVLNESFEPTMERILRASGYTNRFKPKKRNVEPKPVFV